MSRRRYGPACAAAFAAVAVAAGCGGSDSSSSGDSVAATTEATQTSTTAANERLTSTQWAAYQSSRSALRKANSAASATLKKCSAIATQQKTAAVQACVGDTFTELTTAAGNSLSTLQGFQGTVSGSCASALDQLTGQVGLFQASAHQMQVTIDSPTLAGYPAASQSLELALSAGQSEATSFEKECAPA
jgi:hypothetical protein